MRIHTAIRSMYPDGRQHVAWRCPLGVDHPVGLIVVPAEEMDGWGRIMSTWDELNAAFRNLRAAEEALREATELLRELVAEARQEMER